MLKKKQYYLHIFEILQILFVTRNRYLFNLVNQAINKFVNVLLFELFRSIVATTNSEMQFRLQWIINCQKV